MTGKQSLRIPQPYRDRVLARGRAKYLLGLLSRLSIYLRDELIRRYARLRGARIGRNSILTWGLARKANANLTIGEDTVVEAVDLDLRDKIEIGDHVVVNRDVTILRVSHHIDGDTRYGTKYYPPLIIEPYSWLATGCRILPGVTQIAAGTVVGAYSVLVGNTQPNGVYAGNPAILRRLHDTRFEELVVCSLRGGDFMYYLQAKSSGNAISG